MKITPASPPGDQAHRQPLALVTVGSAVADARSGCGTHVGEVKEVRAGCKGLTPEDLKSAYALTVTEPPTPQTVALVVAHDDPNVESDLKRYDKAFGLPACTARSDCLRKLNQRGATEPLPTPNGPWAEEISLDVEAVHAICWTCQVLLVEAETAEGKEGMEDLEAAERTAAASGATEISNSWIAEEPLTDSAAFDHPGIVITAASGDEGWLNWAPGSPEKGHVAYPASSPHVVSVGGTRLERVDGTWTDTVWNGDGVGKSLWGATGGGCSEGFSAPYWQQELPNWAAVGCAGKRSVADISAVADPFTGMAVLDTQPYQEEDYVPGWERVGGTSLSAPLIAAMFALAGGSQGVEFPARTLYENATSHPEVIHDVETGSNGPCASQPAEETGLASCTSSEEAAGCSMQAICLAGTGYDGPSGLGTPDGLRAFQATGAPAKQPQSIEFTSRTPAAARFGGPPYAVAATATSGLGVSFSSATPAVCDMQASTVAFHGVGTCTIEAHQTGNAAYQAASPATQSFAVQRATQTITITTAVPGVVVLGATADALSASASSALAVSFTSITPAVCAIEGENVSFIAAGSCTIEASQRGDSHYEPAPDVQLNVTVRAKPTISTYFGPTLTTPESTLGQPTLAGSSPSATPPGRLILAAPPTVNHRTGAVAFVLSVPQDGQLRWRLAFTPSNTATLHALARGCGKGSIMLADKCRALPTLFASGRRSTRAGRLTLRLAPDPLAERALIAAPGAKRGIRISATFMLSPSGGAEARAQSTIPLDYLATPHRG